MRFSESYNNYSASDIKEIVKSCVSWDVDWYCDCHDDLELLDQLNDEFSKHNIVLVDADLSSNYDSMGNELSWVSPYIKLAYVYNDGQIVVEVSPTELFKIVEGSWASDWTDFRNQLTTTLIHECTHQYQNEQHPFDQSNFVSEYEYLINPEEMAARAFAGVNELLDLGYTKEQLWDKLKVRDLEWMTESDQLCKYIEYLSYEDTAKEIRTLKKYIETALRQS